MLFDVERVAPCLPGAALDGRDGAVFNGSMTIKLGPVTSRYQGTVTIEEADEDEHRAVLRAQATDATGQGTAAATITTVLQSVQDGTHVAVETDLRISGPAAQFGRGVMQDVSGKLMRQFADCLAEEIEADGGTVAGAAHVASAPESTRAAATSGDAVAADPGLPGHRRRTPARGPRSGCRARRGAMKSGAEAPRPGPPAGPPTCSTSARRRAARSLSDSSPRSARP